ncbi:MAG: glycosyltransferase family 2 protein [Planctomycetota bacterium]
MIINFRTADLTIDCLASLAAERDTGVDAFVIVVDNASGDGSDDAIEQAIEHRGWGDWATLERAPDNLGFSGGNNYGLRYCRPGDAVLLLNSDTVVHPGCLDAAVHALNAEPDIAILSCLLLEADGEVQNITRRFPTPARLTAQSLGLPWYLPALFGWADTEDLEWDRRGTARDVDWVGGAFMLLRRSFVDEHGLLDERFFFYGEDIEVCHRARKLGMRVRYDPSGSITHLGGGSSAPASVGDDRFSRLRWLARYEVQRACYGRWASAWLRGLDLFVGAARVVRASLPLGGSSTAAERIGQFQTLLRVQGWTGGGKTA